MKFIAAELVKKSPSFMEDESSLPGPKEPAIGPRLFYQY
jgi:hypothetical protein